MAQSTTNLGKIHVFPSETLYNQFKDIIADNDLALLKDDGAYIVAALLEQNGYVKFSNGLILQWGVIVTGKANNDTTVWFPIAFPASCYTIVAHHVADKNYINPCVTSFSRRDFKFYNENTRGTHFTWIAVGA